MEDSSGMLMNHMNTYVGSKPNTREFDPTTLIQHNIQSKNSTTLHFNPFAIKWVSRSNHSYAQHLDKKLPNPLFTMTIVCDGAPSASKVIACWRASHR
jgi:hypothetical protein